MEFQLTLLLLVPLALAAFVLLRVAILPSWRRAVDRCALRDAEEAAERAGRERAERELRENP